VNATVTEAIAKYQALGQEAPNALHALQAQTAQVVHTVEQLPPALEKTSGFVTDLGSQITATLVGFVSAQAVISVVQGGFHSLVQFVGDSVQSYANAEAAAKKMTAALQAQGTATPGVIAHFNDLATEFQRTTVYSDDLINEMQSLLTQVGQVAPAEMGKALKASTDLASGLGMDLRSATMLVAKAFAGGGDELGRLKALLGDTYKPGMDMAGVLEAINAKFGGQAQAELDTYSGRLKQLANDWDNVKEAIGRTIVEDDVLRAGLRGLSDEVFDLSKKADGTKGSILSFLAQMTVGSVPAEALARAIEHYADSANKAAATTDKFTAAMKSADEMKALIAAALTPPPNAGAAYADFVGKLTAAKQAYRDLAAEQKANFIAANDLHAKDDELMKILGTRDPGVLAVAKQAYDDHKKAVSESAAKLKEYQKVLDEVALAHLPLTLAEKAQVTSLEQLGLSHGKIAEFMKVSEAQVSKYTDTLKENAKSIAEIGKNLEKIPHNVQLRLPSTDLSGIATLVKGGTQLNPTAIDFKAIAENNEMYLTQMAAKAQATYAYMRDHSSEFSEDTIRHFKKIADEARHAADGTKSAWDRAYSAFGDVATILDNLPGKFAEIGAVAARTGQAIMKNLADGNVWGAVVAGATGALQVFTKLFSSAGRDAVKQFADSMGGFDALHQKLLDSLHGVGEQFWVRLTQEVGRGDAKGAAAVIQEIQNALANAPLTGAQLAAQAGYQTQADLQAVADKAKEVYDYMVSSGQYSASQIAGAFKAMQDAQLAAMDETKRAAYDAATTARDAAQKVIDGLNGQIKSLQDSINQEAPEEVMGSIEAQQRAQLASLEAQRQAAQANLDEANDKIADAAQAAVDAASAAAMKAGALTVGAIQDALNQNEFSIHVKVDGLPGGSGPTYGGAQADGGDYYVTKPTYFLAGEKPGGEYVSFSGIGKAPRGGSGRTTVPVVIKLGSRDLWSGLVDVAHEEGLT
jgi:BMFP domain-containing protein YqiC